LTGASLVAFAATVPALSSCAGKTNEPWADGSFWADQTGWSR
jgi:hypothetical protein